MLEAAQRLEATHKPLGAVAGADDHAHRCRARAAATLSGALRQRHRPRHAGLARGPFGRRHRSARWPRPARTRRAGRARHGRGGRRRAALRRSRRLALHAHEQPGGVEGLAVGASGGSASVAPSAPLRPGRGRGGRSRRAAAAQDGDAPGDGADRATRDRPPRRRRLRPPARRRVQQTGPGPPAAGDQPPAPGQIATDGRAQAQTDRAGPGQAAGHAAAGVGQAAHHAGRQGVHHVAALARERLIAAHVRLDDGLRQALGPAARDEVGQAQAGAIDLVLHSRARAVHDAPAARGSLQADGQLGLLAAAGKAADATEAVGKAADAHQRVAAEGHVGADRVAQRRAVTRQAAVAAAHRPVELLGQPARVARPRASTATTTPPTPSTSGLLELGEQLGRASPERRRRRRRGTRRRRRPRPAHAGVARARQAGSVLARHNGHAAEGRGGAREQRRVVVDHQDALREAARSAGRASPSARRQLRASGRRCRHRRRRSR